MLLVIILFLLFMLLGMPVAFAIGISGVFFFLQQPGLPFTMPVQLILTQTQSFTLLAIPLFIFSGNLLNETGITKRLIKLATVLTGHMWGGLAQTNVILSAMMGGVSGSAIADASMEARVLGPDMNAKGYKRGFSAGITGFSSLIVTAIPPSIGLVLYGSIGEVSIGRLFAAGFIPGILMTIALMSAVSFISHRDGYVAEREQRASFKEIAVTFIDCIWAFLFPVGLIVGLRTGIFTPSEAGAFAVAYTIVIGVLVYKEFTWEKFMNTLSATVLDIGMIMLIIAMSGTFSFGLTWDQIPQQLATLLLGISTTPWVVLLIIMAFLIIAGMFMDSTVLIMLLTSILIPVASKVGLDLVHFGIVMVMTLTVGLLTPPVGVVMYVVSSIFECSIGDYMKESVWLFVAIAIALGLMFFFPDLVLFLPNMLFGPA